MPKIQVLMFDSFFNLETKGFIAQMIADLDLNVFTYAPMNAEIKDHAEGKSIVTCYLAGGQTLPVIQDIEYRDSVCGKDRWDNVFAGHPIPQYMWDVTVTGSKCVDMHPLVEQLDLSVLNSSAHKFITPLWGWDDDEVMAAIKYLNIPISKYYDTLESCYDTGTWCACMNCFGKSGTVFCPKAGKKIAVREV